jgi:hypothetical protein
MKKLYFLIFTFLIATYSFGQVILAEGFDYSDGSLVPNGGWISAGGNAGDFLVSSGQAVVQHGTPSEDVRYSFTPVAGNVYVAFDFSVDNLGAPYSAGTDYEYFAHFNGPSFDFRARLDVVQGTGGGDFTVGISSSTSTAQAIWGSDLTFGVIYRAVVRYNQDSGAAELWIDAAAEGDTSIAGLADGATVIEGFSLRQSDSSENETVRVDNLMIGQTFSDVVIFTPSSDPNINFSALSDPLSYDEGSGPSNEANFTVEGTNLIDNITLTPPTNFEISTTSGSGFTTSPIVLMHAAGEVASTPIYVRLVSMLTAGNYTGDLTGTSSGATDRILSLSGDVIDTSITNVGITGNVDGVYINEIHYDNIDGDVGEFVEVAGPAGTDLTDYTISLYNGSDGELYGNGSDTFPLSGTIDDEGSGVGAIVLALPANGLQNGAPDGIALSKTGSGDIQFLSYEGVINNAGDGPAMNLTSEDIGVSESNSTTAAGSSLEYDENSMTWIVILDDTPGDFAQGTLSNDDFALNSFKLFPNPTSTGKVTIFSRSSSVISAQVFDILGKQVMQAKLSNNELNVSALRTGIYILKLKQDNATATKKLVIK